MFERLWSASVKTSGVPVARNASEASHVAVIVSGNPATSARNAWPARRGCRSTAATQNAAIGPNSGPTTMAPTMRIGLSR